VDRDGKRHSVALETKSQRKATQAKLRIEELVAASKTGQGTDAETKLWVSKQKPAMREKLAKVGLIELSGPARAGKLTLGQHVDAYFQKRTDVKASTRSVWSHTRRNLTEFFGGDKPLASITAGDARDFERFLKTQAKQTKSGKAEGLGEDTLRIRIGHAKQFFADAVEHEIIDRNPFSKLRSSVIGCRDRDFFVTLEMVGKVLDACPDAQWRLMVALSRFGGLRCPSELLALRLDSADWDAGRIRVDSPKTEHHVGKAYRIIPMFPELRPYLEERWEQAEPGETHFVTRYRDAKQNLRTAFTKIIKRAGLQPWPKLWHNMRASRQTDLEEVFPSHVVCSWMGNSVQVARKHYLQTTDEHYQKATAGECAIIVASSASQAAANEKSNAQKPAQTSYDSQDVATLSVGTQLELPAIVSEKRDLSPECAKIVATPCIEPPENDDLTAWLATCPANLNDAQRDAIRAIVGE